MYEVEKIIDTEIVKKYQEFKVFNNKVEFKILREGNNIEVFQKVKDNQFFKLSLKDGVEVISNLNKEVKQDLLEGCCNYHCDNC